jgi:hypothetical protein
MKYLLLFFTLIFILFSCDSNHKIIKQDSSGRINNVLVVIDIDQWRGKVGDSLRNIIAKNIVGLPQDEPIFTLSQIDLRNFSNILKTNRNIIFVGLGKKNTFQVKTDLYAAPQKIISIQAKDEKNLFAMFNKHANDIVNPIRQSDLKIYQKKITKKFWKPENIETFKKLGVKLKLPYEYAKVQDTLNYIWFRKEISSGSLNLMVYTVPITSEADENGENIIAVRDEKCKEYIPGSKEGMYVMTTNDFTPLRFDTTLNGKKTYKTHGTWEMKDGFMAGPFLNYTVVDKKNNRLIIAEGFTYAPNIKKRDYMFELEAILITLEIE